MSWRPNGRYYTFSPDVIRACVPPSSGVYGLFNFNHQLFIGESENLQDALLRHRNHSDSQARRHRPSMFAFQLYPADVRKRKAAELIERFRPVRQTEAALTKPARTAADQVAIESSLVDLDHTQIDLEEFSMHERESSAAAQPRYYFESAQGAALIALFAVCMAASFYLGILTGEEISQPADSAKSSAGMAAPAQNVMVDLNEQEVPATEMAGNLSVDIPGWMPTNLDAAVSTATSDPAASLWVPSRPAGGASAQQAGSTVAGSSPLVLATADAKTSKKWSVQISAAPGRDVADTLAEQLKSEGYQSYVVQAQVKGQTFYRVRVGPLDAQEQAESLRQSLARQKEYHDAFLATE
jgi:cell division septation protein DedD